MKTIIKSFLAGFLSTLIFHQGVFGLFYLLKIIPKAPFNMSPTEPFGVPAVISLSFFGGLWGVAIWKLVQNDNGLKHWMKSLIYGAVGPTAVAFLVVFPLKGVEFNPVFVIFGLILNAAWGGGNSLLMKAMKRI
ncbi:hypothetical protein [Bacteriovorax sp. Seq25_V]|uniref:hypothetical protein n=1 Tax=Bacteriovorax sp. Seq25_V TaxID=1201288 RepID=UPI00038A18CE|nr:hypothetical protein [Bacteriovorax sp. Seq25_V]EQC47159.1 hypothetical protein M900_0999 [Bacteriovorax sp. Seq25_V]